MQSTRMDVAGFIGGYRGMDGFGLRCVFACDAKRAI
jgi:hypothetical protein